MYCTQRTIRSFTYPSTLKLQTIQGESNTEKIMNDRKKTNRDHATPQTQPHSQRPFQLQALSASSLAAVSATSLAVLASSASSSLVSSLALPAPPPTSFLTTSTVPSGEPDSAARTLPVLSMTKTPRVVPLIPLRPMAEMRVREGSESRG